MLAALGPRPLAENIHLGEDLIMTDSRVFSRPYTYTDAMIPSRAVLDGGAEQASFSGQPIPLPISSHFSEEVATSDSSGLSARSGAEIRFGWDESTVRSPSCAQPGFGPGTEEPIDFDFHHTPCQ
jgi:hypothetical protein